MFPVLAVGATAHGDASGPMLQRALRRFGRRAGVVVEPEPGGLAPSGEVPIAIRRRRPPADLGDEFINPPAKKNGAAFNRGKVAAPGTHVP